MVSAQRARDARVARGADDDRRGRRRNGCGAARTRGPRACGVGHHHPPVAVRAARDPRVRRTVSPAAGHLPALDSAHRGVRAGGPPVHGSHHRPGAQLLRRVARDGERLRTHPLHGVTVHGSQRKAPALRNIPTSYYYPEGPLGWVVAHAPDNAAIGVVGLGAGSLAPLGRAQANR